MENNSPSTDRIASFTKGTEMIRRVHALIDLPALFIRLYSKLGFI